MSTATVASLFLLLAAVTSLVSTLPVQRRAADNDATPVGGKEKDCLASDCSPPGKRRRKSIDLTGELILRSMEQLSRDEADRSCLGSGCRGPNGKRVEVRGMCLGWNCWQEDHDERKRGADSARDVTAKRAKQCSFGECEGPRNGKRNVDTVLKSRGVAETNQLPQPRKRGQQPRKRGQHPRKRGQHPRKRGQQQRKRGRGGCPPWLCRDPSEIDDNENKNGNGYVSE